MRYKHKFRIRDASLDSQPKILSSSVEGDSSKNYGADQRRLQISDLHFDKFPTPATLARWKIRFKTEICTCSQFPTEAMLWIEEMEMVESVDDLKSSSSTRGIQMPNFEVLDAMIASEQNHPEYPLQEKGQSGKRGPFLSWKADRLLDLRVFPGHWSQTILSKTMPTYLLLVFEMTIFRNSIRSGMEFYCL